MVSNGNGKITNEIQEEVGSTMPPDGYGTKDQIPLYTQTSLRGLLDENKHENKFLNILKAIPEKSRFKKLGPSPSARVRQLAAERDEISRSVHCADQSSPRYFLVPFVRKINWSNLWALCKEWIKEPMNMALLVWIGCVAISGAILFLVMTGMLNSVLPRKSQRDTWFEVNNQILNALFTLMCLYKHPKRFHHLVLLCRWEPKDILRLRKIYCKNGTYKPHEWMHMMVVVILLHLNCFAQYALCGLNLGYPRSKRPAIGVGLCVSVAIVAPAFASVYNILSPLGRDYEIEMDIEAQGKIISTDDSKPAALRIKSLEKRYSFIAREVHGVPESRPEWIGGLFDFWDDISLAFLSVFCSFCVFGWNMERLGFGNMYVHIVTFLLFCTAPFFIFNLAAVNINNDAIREILGITGILLCFFGLLYGGFWRIQMRKKFHLPGNTFCCGHPSVTDCFQWLCCCSCSLAQEVRTADYYDVVEDKLCTKQTSDDNQLALSPLPHEDGLPLFKSTPSSPYRENPGPSLFKMEYSSSPGRFSGGQTPDRHLPALKEVSSQKKEEDEMIPPVQNVIEREDTRAP